MARSKRDDHTLKDERTLPIFIHSTIDDMTDLSPNTMRVYMHLSRRADKSGAAWPSYQSIGDHCFASIYKHPDTRRRIAVEAIADLVKAGLIRKEKRRDDKGQQTNRYVLIDPVIPQSQPHVIPASQGSVIPQSQGIGIVESQPAVIPRYSGAVILRSPEDSPIEDTPKGKNGIIPSSDFWAVCLAELERTLASGFLPTLKSSRVEAAASVADERGNLVPLYRVVVAPEYAANGLNHFTNQAGPAIRRKLGSVLGKPVQIEIVAAEVEAPA